jgi:glucose-6-phosphate-specific signal transduction histidine kinase
VALHAQAMQVDVLWNRRNGVVVLTVEDNGLDLTQTSQSMKPGWAFGMRERVEMLSNVNRGERPGWHSDLMEVPFGDAS